MQSMLRLFLLAVLLSGTTGGNAHAWSMGGHRVTGVMAARELAVTSPQTIAAIVRLIQSHPAAADFNARMRDAGDDPLAQSERLFAEMAQWPDEIRRGPFRDFHRGEWHTIGIPYAVAGYVITTEPKRIDENLLWALRENTRIAADPSADNAARAVALCWVFHLLGDLQQPLHAISLFNAAFPGGDRYGTLFWVRPPAGDEVVSLHYFWDSAVQRSQNMLEVIRTAGQLPGNHPRASLEELRERPYRGIDSFERWAREESHPLAITTAYRDGRLAGATDKVKAPRLSESYAADARALAARRMALAGYRLADVLRALFP
jgi:hypothetical protein